MALIKIASTHKEAMQKTAAIYGVTALFYTNEMNPEVLTVDVQIDDLELMFYFASGVQIEIENERERRINEMLKP